MKRRDSWVRDICTYLLLCVPLLFSSHIATAQMYKKPKTDKNGVLHVEPSGTLEPDPEYLPLALAGAIKDFPDMKQYRVSYYSSIGSSSSIISVSYDKVQKALKLFVRIHGVSVIDTWRIQYMNVSQNDIERLANDITKKSGTDINRKQYYFDQLTAYDCQKSGSHKTSVR